MDSIDTTPSDQVYDGRALVAAFPNRAHAQQAVEQLHDEHFHNIWLGVTQSDGTLAVGQEDSLGAKIGRFFSGEGSESNGGRSLHAALVHHGVAESEAQRLDRSLDPNSVLLTVDGHNHPELAAEIIEACGGHIVAGESFASDTALSGARGSDILGYQDADRFARGEKIDSEKRIQLRSERLTVDKEAVPNGVAEIRKDVISQQQSIDVPTIREELFIERRPVSSETASLDQTPIGQGETIRIPLTREEIRVTKRPVVTEEVLVGKRAISETQRVNETVREERLVTDGGRTSRERD